MKNKNITFNEKVRTQLTALSEGALDRTDPDAPEVTNWAGAIRGRFYHSLKEQISIRMDADVLAWFRAHGDKDQRRINEALREYVGRHSKHP